MQGTTARRSIRRSRHVGRDSRRGRRTWQTCSALSLAGLLTSIAAVGTTPALSATAAAGPAARAVVPAATGTQPIVAGDSITGTAGSSCAVLASSEVACWGYDKDGELGDGVLVTHGPYGAPYAQRVVGVGGSGLLTGAVSVASSRGAYCVLLRGGTVDCWGLGSFGQLGDGLSHADPPYGSASPVEVVSPTGSGPLLGVASVVSDQYGYCAVLTSGSADCWGDGNLRPVAMTGLPPFRSLVGGLDNFCAVLTSSSVDCWGYGGDGELGNGTYYTTSPYGSPTPVGVVGPGGRGYLSGIRSLASDQEGFCAISTAQTAYCWGQGDDGTLGHGPRHGQAVRSAVPVTVLGIGGKGSLAGVTAITADSYMYGRSYCALVAAGGVACWGYGRAGELGDGTVLNGYSAVPVRVLGFGGTGRFSGAQSLTAQAFGYCAVLASSGADCWGSDGAGTLGNGGTDPTPNDVSASPIPVVGTSGSGALSGITHLASTTADTDFTTYCAIVTGGQVDCWGAEGYGALGDGATMADGQGSDVPVVVLGHF